MQVRAKKHLGQHFLRDEEIASRIAEALVVGAGENVLEIGPGMGMLTKYLMVKPDLKFRVVEIDAESVVYLRKMWPDLEIIQGDFLHMSLGNISKEPWSVIGNFPYNISSQIFFSVLNQKDIVLQVVGMLQKEVAERLSAGPGVREYGILSVLLQTWYTVEYLFTVPSHVFDPPPKVQSGVIRLVRNERKELRVAEDSFKKVIKAAFNQRRKMLRNALKSAGYDTSLVPTSVLDSRAEQLSVEDFVSLTEYLKFH